MKVISDKDIRIALTTGAVVLFQAGVEREVSEEIALHALQMGARQIDAEPEPEPEPIAEETPEEPETSEVVEALLGLIAEGDPDNFKVDGTPKAAVVNKLVGRTVSADERASAWEEALNS